MTARHTTSDSAPVHAPVHAPVRDQHGHPLPGTGESTAEALGPAQVDDALAALPGWQRQGSTLVRQISVPADSRDGLREGIRGVAGPERLQFDEGEDSLTVLLAAGTGDITTADIEAAARIDTVLSGSGTDRGGRR